MTAVTVGTAIPVSFGDRDGILANLTTIADTYTWVTGLGTVEAVFITNNASGRSFGATYSGGTVTFAVDSASLNAEVLAIGFN